MSDKKPSTVTQGARYALRLPTGVKRELERLAKEDDRSLNLYIVRVLREHVALRTGKLT